MSVWILRLLVAAALVSHPHDAWSADEAVVQPNAPTVTEPPQEATPPHAATPDQESAEQPGAPPPPMMEAPAPQEPSQPPAAAPDQGPPDPSKVAFAVSVFRVEGNTILPVEQLSAITSQHVGPAQHVSDVEAARAALEKAYREAGYPTVIVAVPEQTIEEGVVRLTVIESKLGAIDVTGNRYFSTRQILAKLPSLRSGVLLHEPTVVKELDVVNANPDRQVNPILTAGKEPGTVDLQLKVTDRLPLHGSLEWNNRGSPNTPEQRLNASVQYNNLFDREQSLGFQTTQTPQKLGEIQAYSLSYLIPLTKPGSLVAIYVAYSDSDAFLNGSVIGVGDVGVTGNQTVIGARYFFPPVTNFAMSYQLSAGIDYKRLGRSEAEFPPLLGQPLGEALVTPPLAYAPLSVAYTGSRADTTGATKVSASFRGYIAGTVRGGTEEDFGGDPNDPINSPPVRLGSTGTFWVLQAGASRLQRLPEGFDGFTVSAAVDGQVTNEPLVSAEQYFAGGMESVRGYLEGEAPGDNALRWSVEILSPEDRRLFPETTKGSWQLAIFYEEAREYLLGVPSGQSKRPALAGVGGGVRLKVTDFIQARVDYAWALRDGPVTEKGKSRAQASLKILF